MNVADTSFLVAFLDRNDAHHRKAQETFANTDLVVIPVAVLVETLGVVKAKAGRPAAAAALEDLIRTRNVLWEESCDLQSAYRIYQEHRTKSLVDAIVIDASRKRATAPLTFDEAQAKAARRAS